MAKDKTTGKTASAPTQGQINPNAEARATTAPAENQGAGGEQSNHNQEVKELAKKTTPNEKLKATIKTEAEKLVEKYHKSYPSNKVFYVTSDNQVFLSADHNMAVLHQKTLKDGELETVKL